MGVAWGFAPTNTAENLSSALFAEIAFWGSLPTAVQGPLRTPMVGLETNLNVLSTTLEPVRFACLPLDTACSFWR